MRKPPKIVRVGDGYNVEPSPEPFIPEGVNAEAVYDETAYLRSFPHKAPWGKEEKPVGAHAVDVDPMTIPPFEPTMGYLRTPPATTPRAALLQEAEKLIDGERNETYGHPTINFSNIAALLNVQFAHKLKDGMSFTAADVAQIQIHTKMARMIAQPKRDNYVDIAGYAACGWEAQEAGS